MAKRKKAVPIDEEQQRRMIKVEGIAEFLTDLGELLSSKNQDYGDDNIHTLGQKGIYVRMSDKMARLKNWMWYEIGYVSNETVRDTLMDLAGYCVIAALMEEHKW